MNIPIFLITCVAILVIVILAMIKNNIVYQANMKALQMSSQKAKQLIDSNSQEWRLPYEIMNSYDSYNEMAYDVFRWNFDTLYPNLDERLKLLG